MNDLDKGPPPLGGTMRDNAVSLVKGAVGAIPLAGSVLAETVSMVIPQQRIQRLEAYVRYLNAQLQHLEATELRQHLEKAESIYLFEDGAHQAARALSDERRQRIAHVVANGMTGDDRARLEAKRVLSLLDEVDDGQIIILAGHLTRNREDQAFWQKHASVLEPIGAVMGSSQEDLDRETMFNLARQHLTRLGLLRPYIRRLRKGELPEFDTETGTLKSHGHEITEAGRLFLARLGLAEPGEL